jgi:hypothetical protein
LMIARGALHLGQLAPGLVQLDLRTA